MSFLYNVATAICVIAVVAMVLFSVVAFRTELPGQRSANFAGKVDTLPESPGIKSLGTGLKQKDYK